MARDGYLELEYATVSRITDFAEIDARWSVAARDTLKQFRPAPMQFGAHERQAVDLFAPVAAPTGLLLFVHGGYFQRRHRRDFAWLVPTWLERGIAVALVGYRLCPEVSLVELIGDVDLAVRMVLRIMPGIPSVIGGHSAGGHLAATMASRMPMAFRGCLPTSGVFELPPLLGTSLNDALRLDYITANTLSAMYLPAPKSIPVFAAVGGAESSEFLRQSQGLARRWRAGGANSVCVEFPGLNHFTMQDEWGRPSSPLMALAIGMFSTPSAHQA